MARPCIIKTERDDGPYGDASPGRRIHYTTWCGEGQYTTVGLEAYPFGQRCPKCSAKFYGSITPAGWTLEKVQGEWGWKAETNPYQLSNGWKSVYVAKHNGERVALIMIANGWGEQWEIRSLRAWLSDDATIDIVSGGEAKYTLHAYDHGGAQRILDAIQLGNGTTIPKREPPKDCSAKRFNSKEQALFFLRDMLADGYVKTETAMMEDGARLLEQRAARLAQKVIDDREREEFRQRQAVLREEQARQDAEDTDMITLALAEMTTEGKISNFQREALFIMAKRLGIKGLEG